MITFVQDIPGLDRPLTPDECQALAASLADLPPAYQLTPVEIELLQEQQFGQPLRYAEPGRAATAMKVRLAHLLGEKATALNTMEDCAEYLYAELTADVQRLNVQITETRTRLAEYLRQQSSAN